MKYYVDMDGVLTNWDAAVRTIGIEPLPEDAPAAERQAMYDRIEEAGEAFWANMEWMPGAQALWNTLQPLRPTLLSSPGLFTYAPSGKQRWVAKHIPGTPLFLENDKFRYAERDAVLIDDNTHNIGGWQEAGGIGIHHTSPDTTLQALKKIRTPLASILRDIATPYDKR